MVPPTSPLSQISNPLIHSSQLLRFKSTSHPYTPSTQFATFLLTQTAGIFLRLPQESIATAIILLQRYLISYLPLSQTRPPTTSPDTNPSSPHHLSAAAIYLSSKLSSHTTSPRSISNVYAFLLSKESSPLAFINPSAGTSNPPPDESTYFVSEGTYQRTHQQLLQHESHLLAGLGFNLNVALPHSLALTYLSALGVLNSPTTTTSTSTDNNTSTTSLPKRVLEHLNSALLSPQLLYLTHQPNVLATAAIYLASKEVGVKLVGSVNWWEVFDVGREELGFVVVAMGSLSAFAEAERRGWVDGEGVDLL